MEPMSILQVVIIYTVLYTMLLAGVFGAAWFAWQIVKPLFKKD